MSVESIESTIIAYTTGLEKEIRENNHYELNLRKPIRRRRRNYPTSPLYEFTGWHPEWIPDQFALSGSNNTRGYVLYLHSIGQGYQWDATSSTSVEPFLMEVITWRYRNLPKRAKQDPSMFEYMMLSPQWYNIATHLTLDLIASKGWVDPYTNKLFNQRWIGPYMTWRDFCRSGGEIVGRTVAVDETKYDGYSIYHKPMFNRQAIKPICMHNVGSGQTFRPQEEMLRIVLQPIPENDYAYGWHFQNEKVYPDFDTYTLSMLPGATHWSLGDLDAWKLRMKPLTGKPNPYYVR